MTERKDGVVTVSLSELDIAVVSPDVVEIA
jgi:hypothetical protein